MSINITCSGCDSSFNIQDRFAWKKWKCPKCWSIIHIPNTEDIIEIVEDTDMNGVENETQTNYNRIIKPKYFPLLLFLSVWLFYSIIVVSVSFTWLFILLIMSAWIIGYSIFLISLMLAIYTIYIRYVVATKEFEKTEYRFFKDRIEYYDWFLVKRKKTILIANITDVSETQGVIEKKFGLGTIMLSTAWSHWYEIIMSNIDNPDEVYSFVKKVISNKPKIKNKNEYQCAKTIKPKQNIDRKLLKVITPKIIKSLVFLDAIHSAIYTVIGISFLLIYFISFETLISFKMTYVWIIGILIPIFFIIQKKEMNNTRYEFYSDRIQYYNGFLAKNKTSVKLENITDVWLKQSLLERTFWLWTIQISTAWSHGYEVSMNNLEHPDRIYKFLDEMIS